MKKKSTQKGFFALAEKSLPEKRIQEAHSEARKEILKIRLSELRKEFGIKQTEIETFSQPAVSRLEARKDMKISTLMQYVHSLGLSPALRAELKSKNV